MLIKVSMKPIEYVYDRLKEYRDGGIETCMIITEDVIGAFILRTLISVDTDKVYSHGKNDFDREGDFFTIPEWYWDQLNISQKQLRGWRDYFRRKGVLIETRKGKSTRLKMKINYEALACILADDREDEVYE